MVDCDALLDVSWAQGKGGGKGGGIPTLKAEGEGRSGAVAVMEDGAAEERRSGGMRL